MFLFKKVEVEGGRMESCCAMPLLWMNSQTHSRKLFCSDRSFGELGIVVGIPRHAQHVLRDTDDASFPAHSLKATIFCGYLSSGAQVKFHCCGHGCVVRRLKISFFEQKPRRLALCPYQRASGGFGEIVG